MTTCAFNCAFNCDRCLPDNGPHVCRYCKGENIHLSSYCPIITKGTKNNLPSDVCCFFCKAENLHCSNDCPKVHDYPAELAEIVIKKIFLNTNTRKHSSSLFKLLINSYEQFEKFINSNECQEVYETEDCPQIKDHLKFTKLIIEVFKDSNKNREFQSVFNTFINSNKQFTEFNNVKKLRKSKAKSVSFDKYLSIYTY